MYMHGVHVRGSGVLAWWSSPPWAPPACAHMPCTCTARLDAHARVCMHGACMFEGLGAALAAGVRAAGVVVLAGAEEASERRGDAHDAHQPQQPQEREVGRLALGEQHL